MLFIKLNKKSEEKQLSVGKQGIYISISLLKMKRQCLKLVFRKTLKLISSFYIISTRLVLPVQSDIALGLVSS